ELIRVGDTYYLFGDYHPEGAGSDESHMSVAYWHSKDLYAEFEFGGFIRGNTHPDPTVGFAEGEFLMILQIDHQDGYEGDNKDLYGGENDEYFADKVATLTSAGPWVDAVQARAGVDTDGDGEVDEWTVWQDVTETYGRIDGFAKVYSVDEAMLDLSALPDGYGIQFEFSTGDLAAVMDSVSIESTTVPEPASMALLAIGGLGILLRPRRSR
ncbi:MAG: PEP-CTERM sorting domain-containing protein, partial [Phycisphaerae bacterium]